MAKDENGRTVRLAKHLADHVLSSPKGRAQMLDQTLDQQLILQSIWICNQHCKKQLWKPLKRGLKTRGRRKQPKLLRKRTRSSLELKIFNKVQPNFFDLTLINLFF